MFDYVGIVRREPIGMVALAICYFGAGALTGACLMRLVESKGVGGVSTSRAVLPKIPATARSVVLASTQLANPLKRLYGKVVNITDGDTVDVLTPGNLTYAVRLAGILPSSSTRANAWRSAPMSIPANLICPPPPS
jgi:hypothetical protein